MANLSTLTDNFNDDSISASWDDFEGGNAQIAEQNKRIEINLPASADSTADGDISSVSTYDLTGNYGYLQVIEVPNAETNANAELRIFTDSDNWFRWVYEEGRLFAQYKKAGLVSSLVDLTWLAADYRFWRIREASGIVYWETSSDAQEWVIETQVTHGMTITAMKVLIAAICYKDETNPGNFIVDNFNITPIARLKDNFNDNDLNLTRWDKFEGGSATLNETNRRIEINYPASSTSSTDGDITSDNAFDLDESEVILETLEMPDDATSADAELRVFTDANNWFRFVYEGGTLFMQRRNAGASATIASLTYSAITHRWWKIAEASGTITWYTSLDGKTWTSRGTYVHGMNISAMKVLIAGTCFQNETNPGRFVVDNLNYGDIKVKATDIPLILGHSYRLSFEARATVSVNVQVQVTNEEETVENLSSDFHIKEANVWNTRKFEFTATETDEHSTLIFKPDLLETHSFYVERVSIIDLTIEQKNYRLMRIQGSMRPGSFVQTLTLREVTDSEV
jgi:hypothetical protein